MTFWVAGAVVVSSAIGASAAGDAADSQRSSTDASIGEQRRQFDLTRGDFAPYREAGVNALKQYVREVNRMPTAAEVMAEPGYQFGLDQGQEGIDRKIAAMGGRVSGAAIKAAGRFATNYATTGYGAAYQRREDRKNRLAAIANIGQTATGASAVAGSKSANAISAALESQGDATAASQLARGSIWGNAGNQIAAMYRRQPINGWGAAPGGYSGYSTTPLGQQADGFYTDPMAGY